MNEEGAADSRRVRRKTYFGTAVECVAGCPFEAISRVQVVTTWRCQIKYSLRRHFDGIDEETMRRHK